MTRQSRSEPSEAAGACACAPLQTDERAARTIWHLARWYAAKGWTVRTRLPGWGLPPRVGGHMPALYASDGEQEVTVDLVVPGLPPPSAAHRSAFRAWQNESTESRRYSLEVAHISGANRVESEPSGGWVDGDGRNFW